MIAAGRARLPSRSGFASDEERGAPSLVQLGVARARTTPSLFDLAVTPAYCGLFPHPRRIETSATLQP